MGGATPCHLVLGAIRNRATQALGSKPGSHRVLLRESPFTDFPGWLSAVSCRKPFLPLWLLVFYSTVEILNKTRRLFTDSPELTLVRDCLLFRHGSVKSRKIYYIFLRNQVRFFSVL